MYLAWDQKTITDWSDLSISSLYNQGYVFTRIDKGILNQTRSIRVNLQAFEPSSENKRILRKVSDIELRTSKIPLDDYHWEIGKLGKNFYETKFGEGTFSANKIKELLTSEHNFNTLLTYLADTHPIGYCIAYENNDMLHYSYPFYDLETDQKNTGMGMMLKAIEYAKKTNKKYIYLGSAQRPTDTYKLQFKGLEWYDGKKWKTNINALKKILNA